MLILSILEFLFFAAFVYAIATQIVIPFFTDRPMFPAFRKKARELDEELKEVNQELVEKAVEEEISTKRKILKGEK